MKPKRLIEQSANENNREEENKETKDLIEKIKDEIIKEKSISYLSQKYNITEYEVLGLIKKLKDTGINIFQYLNRLLYFDTLILNEDRHYMNLGVAYDKSNGFMQASCFDNGSSMFCTNWTYRKTKTLSENLQAAKSVARPFSKFYDNQILALQKLGAKPLKISKVNLDDIFVNYNSVFYNREQQDLALSVLKARLDYNTDKGVFVYV